MFYWFHSSNPVASYQSGVPSGSKQYNGAEQLILNYTNALTTNMQIDVYAASTSVFLVVVIYIYLDINFMIVKHLKASD